MDVIELLSQLVSYNTTSPPGNERPAALFLAEILKPHGFQCEVQDLGDNRANFIAYMGEGPELMLNGHLDVVPALGQWNTDPFTVTHKGQKLYGRGTSDMKGGIAAMCAAAIRTAQKGGPGKGKLKLLFVADEECSNLGIINYLKSFPAPQYAIIGEPTGLNIAVAHRGVLRNYIDISGSARHAALPSSELDSVKKVPSVIAMIERMNEELKAIKHEVLPPPGISVTMIQGYEKDNVVPGTIRMLLDFRIHPDMSQEQAEKILKDGLEKSGISGYTVLPHFYMPGGEVPSKSPFVQFCLNERNSLLGTDSIPLAFDASCEQCYLEQYGAQALICGPGDLKQAHIVDEYITQEQLMSAVDLYEKIIDKFTSK